MSSKIVFICPPSYPIPAIKGGAIETLITALLNENEIVGKYDLVVCSKFCSEAVLHQKKYLHTKFININEPFLLKMYFIFYKILRKISGYRIPYRDSYTYSVKKVLKALEANIVVVETSNYEVSQISKDEDCILIYHVHADYLKENSYGINFIKEKVDYFWGVSDFISNQLKCLFDNNKVFTFRNAISVRNIDNKEYKFHRKKIREQYLLKESDFIFVYTGRLSKEKGCLELISALNDIEDCKLLVLGGANFSDDSITPYVQELKQCADVHPGKVIFTGYIDHSKIDEYICAGDVGVVPSICNEACSLALLEFRMCGLPTIVTNIGGIPEYCDENTSIFVDYSENFISNLQSACRQIKDNKQLRDKLRENSRSNIDDYDYKQYYKQFEKLIQKVMKNNE